MSSTLLEAKSGCLCLLSVAALVAILEVIWNLCKGDVYAAKASRPVRGEVSYLHIIVTTHMMVAYVCSTILLFMSSLFFLSLVFSFLCGMK